MGFIEDGSVPNGKVDLNPVPPGEEDDYFSAEEWNGGVCQSLLDLRTQILNGYFGFDETSSAPGDLSGFSSSRLWGENTGNLVYTRLGVDRPIALGTVSAKGDLLVFNGTNYEVVSVGADNDALVADSTQPAGVKWSTGGGTGNWVFSGNNADLASAGVLKIGGTHTNSITLDAGGADLFGIGVSTQFGSPYYELKGASGIHNLGFRNADGTGVFPQTSQMWIYVSGSAVARWDNNDIAPNTDLGLDLGTSSLRWSHAYLGQDAIATAQTASLLLTNKTAATSIATQQSAPAMEFQGAGWGTTGGATQAVSALIQGVAESSTVGLMDLSFSLQHGGGSLTELMRLTEKHPSFGYLAGRPTLYLPQASAGYIYQDNELVINAGSTFIDVKGSGQINLHANVVPDASLTYGLGISSLIWNNAWIAAIAGGSSNTTGHVVPNIADDTFALLNATQTMFSKTINQLTVGSYLSMPGVNIFWDGNSDTNWQTGLGAAGLGGAGYTRQIVTGNSVDFIVFGASTSGVTIGATGGASIAEFGQGNSYINGTLKIANGATTFATFSSTLTTLTQNLVVPKIGPNATNQHTLPAVTPDTVALLAATQNLTNKTLAAGTVFGNSITLSASGSLTIGTTSSLLKNIAVQNLIGGSSNTNGHVVPNVADDTLALLAATQTFTNKTLTSPTISSPAFSGTEAGTRNIGGTPTLTAGLTTNAFIGPNYGGTSTNLPTVSWTSPSLSNSWTNVGSPYSNTSYYKDSMGIVHLRIAVSNTSSSATIFTLPTGFRPANATVYVGIGSSFSTFVAFEIDSNGNVTPDTATTRLLTGEVHFMAEN